VRSNNRLADEKDWKLNSSAFETLDVAGHMIPVAVTTITSGSRKLKLWSFYVVGGSVEVTVWSVKLQQLRDYFSHQTCSSAFVAIAAESSGIPKSDDRKAVRYLSAMQSLPPYLCGSKVQ
jgi:EpsI family protein